MNCWLKIPGLSGTSSLNAEVNWFMAADALKIPCNVPTQWPTRPFRQTTQDWKTKRRHCAGWKTRASSSYFRDFTSGNESKSLCSRAGTTRGWRRSKITTESGVTATATSDDACLTEVAEKAQSLHLLIYTQTRVGGTRDWAIRATEPVQ